MEIPISEHLVVVAYADRPGVIGTHRPLLGMNNVNIAGMQVARQERGRAGAGPADHRQLRCRSTSWTRIKAGIGADMAREVDLED